MASRCVSPCYDYSTKTSCPRRKAGCAVDCPEWNDYMHRRNELYVIRGREHDMEEATYKVRIRPIVIRKKKNGKK